MIIVRVTGGLGNQMFQYAAGLALASSRSGDLRCDLSFFDSVDCHQGFELERIFGEKIVRATDADCRAVLGWRGVRVVRSRLAGRLRAMRPESYACEPHFHFWPSFFSLPEDVYLDGCWQSERYFYGIAARIRKAFSFAPPLAGRNAELAALIAESECVALHVRRGDYVANRTASEVHGVCALSYYEAAIRHISERVASPCFLVFSDDIGWVRDNLPMESPCHFVDHNRGAESWNDMRLMSLCQHQIVANSSFSWWGAWLNANPQKVVVAPMRWFNSFQADTKDLLPNGWVAL